jgi:NTP pyrophosphatase (non-canonical NTP hydrolase)
MAEKLSLESLLWAAKNVSEWLDDPRNVPPGFGGPNSPANHVRRITKVCEESGEVWKAWSRATGENPRLGVATEAWDEVCKELADTAMAALAGLFHVLGREEAVREQLRVAALKSASRAGAWYLEHDGEYPTASELRGRLAMVEKGTEHG